MKALRLVTSLALALAAAIPTALAPPASAQLAAGSIGTSAALTGYRIQSTAKTSDTGATVSQPGYPATGWYAAAPRSTVLGALLQNGVYADPFYSTNMKNIPTTDFTVPWWFRSEFSLADEPGVRTYLDFSGVISRADVFVNGVQVATNSQIAGAYPRFELDVTAQARVGTNAVAFRISPNNASSDLTTGWIDWLQNPPDRNMGIFRDVKIKRAGPVSLRGAHVLTSVTSGLDSATLTAKVDARNDTASAVTAVVSGSVAGVAVSSTITLAARESKTVTFSPVTLASPQIWWPAGMGAQPLYNLTLSASVGGTVTDTAASRFGVRTVTGTLDASGHRAYKINGHPLLIRGGGWSPDVFLRWDPVFVQDKIRYALDLGLNTIRLEGHLEPDEFFDLADEMGMLVLPGWECCNKWEASSWTSADYAVAKASMSGEAIRLRDHPSVISFLIGSDNAPPAAKETPYVDALRAADWPTPIIAAASDNSSPITGSSGMKMPGPYEWVPPNYWYNKREGGAFGFNSETSAGPDVPTLDTLRRMMSASELATLWQNPTSTQYHRSPSSTFDDLGIFNNAMIGRYGTPASLDDYVRKAQLQQYENVRAQFEAYGRNFKDSSNPSTGVVYWMLNSGWTSLHWQLFDRYFDQNGAYYGAKKANEPLHVQYSYDTKSVVVVNSRVAAASGLSVTASVYNLDGTQKSTQTANSLSVAGDGGRTTALTIPSISGLSGTYLVKLTLRDAGGTEVSRNVYWLSTSDDVIDWSGNDWYYVPTSSYANLKGLTSMASTTVSASASTTTDGGGTSTTSVTLRNTSTGLIPAFYLDAHVVDAAGAPVLPIRWTDNAVSLWPGESTTLTATYRTADLHGSAPSVRVAGWNTGTQTVPAGSGEPDVVPPTVPGSPRTTAVSASSVTVCWDASTDNVGVVRYDVFRDGVKVGSVTPPATCFTDTTVQPDTTYAYTVKAYDAAGLSSAASTAISVTTPTAPSGPTRYEAENATISQGVVEANHLNYSGTGFVNYDNVTGSYVEWTVSTATATSARLDLRYANGTTTDRPMTITVDGTAVATGTSFAGTGNWDTWATKSLTVSLSSGTHKVRATATTANGGPNADHLEVTPLTPKTRYEAENATISQGVVEANHLNYSGTGFVNCDNVVGSYTQWTVSVPAAGSYAITVHYSNGTTANRPADITVNGAVVAAARAFPVTADWDTWADVSLTVTLTAGTNTIRVTGTTTSGPANLDYLEVG
ncbi:MAG: carbohydrate-binding protein [Hamadaea sp.]|nr:carbohydrate-binding protein [Hamadaea sp.]